MNLHLKDAFQRKGAVDQDSNVEIFLPDWDPNATGPQPPNLRVGGAWNKLWLLSSLLFSIWNNFVIIFSDHFIMHLRLYEGQWGC